MQQKPRIDGLETPPIDANGRSDVEALQTPVEGDLEPLTADSDEALRDELYYLDIEGERADDIILELARRIKEARGQS